MNTFVRFALPLLALPLAACVSTGPAPVVQAPVATAPMMAAPIMPSPAQTTHAALSTTSISSGFVDPAALTRMTAKDTAEANSAQFYALQFGRPGAPRQWAGDQGATGSVTVGPYVRVNNLDCRDFTHTVKIGGQDYIRKGTACREQTGNWAVVPGAA